MTEERRSFRTGEEIIPDRSGEVSTRVPDVSRADAAKRPWQPARYETAVPVQDTSCAVAMHEAIRQATGRHRRSQHAVFPHNPHQETK